MADHIWQPYIGQIVWSRNIWLPSTPPTPNKKMDDVAAASRIYDGSSTSQIYGVGLVMRANVFGTNSCTKRFTADVKAVVGGVQWFHDSWLRDYVGWAGHWVLLRLYHGQTTWPRAGVGRPLCTTTSLLRSDYVTTCWSKSWTLRYLVYRVKQYVCVCVCVCTVQQLFSLLTTFFSRIPFNDQKTTTSSSFRTPV